MIKVSNEWLDEFHQLGAKEGKARGLPPAKKLSMLLRPAFIAAPGKTLVWGDWSNIEARVLPLTNEKRPQPVRATGANLCRNCTSWD